MEVARKKRSEVKGDSQYATRSDFCAIFTQHVQSLYLLALLLTGDGVRAEQCFLAGFELCEGGSPVFKESVVAWSRRSVIKSAIKLTFSTLSSSAHPGLADNHKGLDVVSDASLKRVQNLPLLNRFVFVMTVLERYSDRDCALLLGCSYTDIPLARIRAFQEISTSVERSCLGYGKGTQPYVADPDWLECG